MMTWIAEGERVNIPGWRQFLSTGPGGGGYWSANSTRGAYFELEYLSRELKWTNVVELERGLGRCTPLPWLGPGVCRYQRYVDIVVRETDAAGNVREVFKEHKNLSADATFGFGSQVKFDVQSVLQESLILNGGRLVETDLASRLGQIEYVLGGSPEEMAAVISGLTRRIEKVLSALKAQHLAKHVKITPLNLPLPI
jgi:hypothetical protein